MIPLLSLILSTPTKSKVDSRTPWYLMKTMTSSIYWTHRHSQMSITMPSNKAWIKFPNSIKTHQNSWRSLPKNQEFLNPKLQTSRPKTCKPSNKIKMASECHVSLEEVYRPAMELGSWTSLKGLAMGQWCRMEPAVRMMLIKKRVMILMMDRRRLARKIVMVNRTKQGWPLGGSFNQALLMVKICKKMQRQMKIVRMMSRTRQLRRIQLKRMDLNHFNR